MIHPRATRPGFTLVELLVVIAVIVLLIGILLPVLGRAKDTGMAAKCMSNLHQMGLACNGYINDYAYYYPQPFQDSDLGNSQKGAALWFNALDYYVNNNAKNYLNASSRNYNPFKQDPVYDSFMENTAVTGGNGSRTFKMNVWFGDLPTGSVHWTKDQEITQTSRTVFLFDGVSRDLGIDLNDDENAAFHGDANYIGIRHADAANVLFADEHAERIKQAEQKLTSSPSGLPYQAWYVQPDTRQALIWNFR